MTNSIWYLICNDISSALSKEFKYFAVNEHDFIRVSIRPIYRISWSFFFNTTKNLADSLASKYNLSIRLLKDEHDWELYLICTYNDMNKEENLKKAELDIIKSFKISVKSVYETVSFTEGYFE